MPISGEMRLRQLTLALIALSSIWVGVVAQRTDHSSRRSAGFTLGPTPPNFSGPKQPAKLVHVPGLKRPAAATPIVVRQPAQHYVHATGGAPARARPSHRAQVKPAVQPQDETQVVEGDSRSYAY